MPASVAEAGREAGYTTKQATYKAVKRIRRNAQEILDEIGYGQVKAIQDLREMADAEETKFFPSKGIVMEHRDVKANDIRLRARVELNKIHGHYPKEMRDDATGGLDRAGIVINLGFLDSKRAERILAKLAGHRIQCAGLIERRLRAQELVFHAPFLTVLTIGLGSGR